MNNRELDKYFEDNKAKVEFGFNEINDGIQKDYDIYFDELKAIAKSLLSKYSDEEQIKVILTDVSKNQSFAQQVLTVYWLAKAFDEDILHYKITLQLSELYNRLYFKYIRGADYDKYQKEKEILNKYHVKIVYSEPGMEELFLKEKELNDCDNYIERRKVYVGLIERYNKKINYYSNSHDSYHVPINAEQGIKPDFVGIYKNLLSTIKNELENLEKQEEIRLLEENSLNYFISEDVLGHFYDILAVDYLIEKDDGPRLWYLLQQGTNTTKKIRLKISPKAFAHSIWQLAERKLILNTSRVVLGKWVIDNFELSIKDIGSNKLSDDTIRKYMSDRKNSSRGEEVIKVIKIKKTKNGPNYVLERVHN